MAKSTNEHFTHDVAPDAAAKNSCVSLTFRHLIATDFPPLKKQRLNLDLFRTYLAPLQQQTNEVQHNELLTKMGLKPTFPDVLPCYDWLDVYYQKMDTPDPLLAEFTIQRGVYLQILSNDKLCTYN